MTCVIVGTPPLSVEWVRVGGASLPSTATQMEPVEIGTNLVRHGSLAQFGCYTSWEGGMFLHL